MTPVDALLVNPRHVQGGLNYAGNDLPLSLAYLAAFLDSKGVSTEVLDLEIEEDPLAALKGTLQKTRPQFVGISAFTIDAVEAHEIAKSVKTFDGSIVTVLGGLHATAIPEQALREAPYVDYAIFGEGFYTFYELISAIREKRPLREVEGVVYRDGQDVRKTASRKLIVDLDDLPFPAREKFKLESYRPHPGNYFQLPSTGIMASWGCPFSCTFCTVHLAHPGIRWRSPENVVAEIKDCIDRFGIHDFNFYDDCFTCNMRWAERLCRLIIKEGLKMTWMCETRVDKVTARLLRVMEQAGCYHVSYGVEVGTEISLKRINKAATLRDAREAISLTKKTHMETKASFILGVPGETVEDVRATIRFAKELSPDLVTFYIHKAYPGSPVYQAAEARGEVLHRQWDSYLIHNPPALSSQLPAAILNKLLKSAYYSFYFRPAYILQRLRRLCRSPSRELRLTLEGAKLLCSYSFKAP